MIAVIVATKREADAVRPALRGMTDAVLFVSGVGKVNAAVAAMSAIWAGAEAVVNVGLVGAVDPRRAAGGTWCVSEAVQYDVDLSAVDGTDVGMVDGRSSRFFSLELVPGLPTAWAGTADRFASGDADRAVLAAMGCGLADMECAAIAQVCERTKTPLFAVKVVSDAMDGMAYNADADRFAGALADAVRDAVDAARSRMGDGGEKK